MVNKPFRISPLQRSYAIPFLGCAIKQKENGRKHDYIFDIFGFVVLLLILLATFSFLNQAQFQAVLPYQEAVSVTALVTGQRSS